MLKKRNFTGLILLMLLMVITPASVTGQRGSPVNILVVDDFYGSNLSYFSAYANSLKEIYREEINNLVAQYTNGSGLESMVQDAGDSADEQLWGLTDAIADVVRNQIRIDMATEAIRIDWGTDYNSAHDTAMMGIVSNGLDASFELENMFCAVNMEGQAGTAATRGAALGDLTVPHGQIVRDELDDLQGRKGTGFNIVNVDTGGFSTKMIASQIERFIIPGELNVVNMSFAVVPCASLPKLAAYEMLMLQSAEGREFAALQRLFRQAIGFYDSWIQSENNAGQGGSIRQCEKGCELARVIGNYPDGNVIFVAAAGNMGLPYPFWPAAWNEVVAVSASNDAEDYNPLNGLDGSSNWGEVLLPGAFGSVWGTSFAAPRLSFVMANYLSRLGGDVCNNNGAPALSYGGVDNLNVWEASNSFCPDVGALVP